jgi:hypothetical protein
LKQLDGKAIPRKPFSKETEKQLLSELKDTESAAGPTESSITLLVFMTGGGVRQAAEQFSQGIASYASRVAQVDAEESAPGEKQRALIIIRQTRKSGHVEEASGGGSWRDSKQ